jgi:hypothetical protein
MSKLAWKHQSRINNDVLLRATQALIVPVLTSREHHWRPKPADHIHSSLAEIPFLRRSSVTASENNVVAASYSDMKQILISQRIGERQAIG